MYDNVLILYEDMVRYWYCANIPPRPLDDKAPRFEKLEGKRREKEFWTNQRLRKKNGLKQNFSQDVGCACRRETRWEVGGWAVGRDKSVRTVGSVREVGEEEDFNKCGVGREGGRGGVQTCERDGRCW